jgi:hypothetical protein
MGRANIFRPVVDPDTKGDRERRNGQQDGCHKPNCKNTCAGVEARSGRATCKDKAGGSMVLATVLVAVGFAVLGFPFGRGQLVAPGHGPRVVPPHKGAP